MSRTIRDSKGCGFDYWKSRLPDFYAEGKPGRYTKKRTHKYERRVAKKLIKDKYQDEDK